MTVRLSAGRARVVASEDDVLFATTEAWAGVHDGPGVIYCHGVDASAFTQIGYTVTGEWPLLNALAARWPLIMTDLGGIRTFGNATAVTRIGQAKTYLQSVFGLSGPVLLLGASGGALAAINYLKANPTQVAAVAGVVPGVDLNDLHANNRGGFQAAINTAYGGSYVEATHGPTYNPANYAATLPSGVPVGLFYASNDTIAVPSTVTEFDAAAPNCTLSNVGALGHTQAAIAAAIIGVVSFLAAA